MTTQRTYSLDDPRLARTYGRDYELPTFDDAEDPSDLLEIAIRDAIKAATLKGFTVNMATWIDTSWDDCHVCLAGAAVMGRFCFDTRSVEQATGHYAPNPESFSTDIKNKMYAINAMRDCTLDLIEPTLKISISAAQLKSLSEWEYTEQAHAFAEGNGDLFAGFSLVELLRTHNL